jgi:hypothetical protein
MYRVCHHIHIGCGASITPDTDTGTVTAWRSTVVTVGTVRFVEKQAVQFAYTVLLWANCDSQTVISCQNGTVVQFFFVPGSSRIAVVHLRGKTRY